MQWLQDPKHNNINNLNNVKCEASRLVRKKGRNI
jgi:hypothetical protein